MRVRYRGTGAAARQTVSLVAFIVCVGWPRICWSSADVVTFRNGDHLTGDLKSLERGMLRFKTVATSTISIEWDEVVRIESRQNIQVEIEDGSRYLGRLSSGPGVGEVTITTTSGNVALEMSRVILMTPIKEKGISRLDGDITVGFDFTKASEIRQVLVGANYEMHSEARRLSIRAEASLTDSRDNDSSQRQNLSFNYRRLWPHRWLTGGFLILERNDELNLDLRTSIGGGGGRILRQTNHSMFALEGGLMFSRENVSGTSEDKDTIEAFGTITWEWYRLDTPELDLSTSFQVIPNLTETGRLRSEWDINLKWEIVKDLFWQLSVYNSYDSDPTTEGANKNDYGISTSAGWSF